MSAFVGNIGNAGYGTVADLALHCEIPLLCIREVVREGRAIIGSTLTVIGCRADIRRLAVSWEAVIHIERGLVPAERSAEADAAD